MLIDENGLLKTPEIVADIAITANKIETDLLKQIQQYLHRRKVITKQFLRNESIAIEELTIHPADKEFLDQVNANIQKHISDAVLDSDILCKELHMSRTVLYSKIKQLTGMGVHEYIKMIRVKKSIELLKERKLNVSQIAYEVGFSSPSYYIRCFVKQFGLPPKEYINKK